MASIAAPIPPVSIRSAGAPPPPAGVTLARADFDALVEGLDRLEPAEREDLERLISTATVVDAAPGAGLGAVVSVGDEDGRTREYALVARRSPGDELERVSLGSPIGRALLGARAGDVVHVALPSGRTRALTVLGVRAPAAG